MPVDAVTLVLLLVAAFTAGTIDAVVGGGGLIQLPALLVGLPGSVSVATVSGTNKISSVAGTAVATGNLLRSVRVHLPTAVTLMGCAALGSSLGAQLVRFLSRDLFTPLVLVVVIGVGVYTYRRPTMGLVSAPRVRGWRKLASAGAIGLGVGAYDGLIGPGTGTFFIVLLVSVLGLGFLEANTYTKLANLTTNLAAISVFATHGYILWPLGLTMAAANLTGGFVGSMLAVRGGNAFVRKVFLLVVGGLACKLAWDTGVLALRWR